ncbi:hypothetical protein ACFWIW_02855 [Amycolatopsis sp. NPDC058340]|uniref:hypothetical protein n=1 Tax=Amycolatopsis sp. NPDC058340 TaxID=3346453 RepID=UPI00364CEF79
MAFEADGGQAAPDFSIGSAVGAAANYVAMGGLNAAAIAQVSAETQKLVSAAKSGGFKITEEGVKPLLQAVRDMGTELARLERQTIRLSEAPQLGDHPYGRAVAAHDHKGAAQSANSASAVLGKFKQVVQDTEEALLRASGQYKKKEQDTVEALDRLKN